MFGYWNKTYFMHSVAALATMNALFFAISGDIFPKDHFLFIRKSIACAAAIYISQIIMQRSFYQRIFLAPMSFCAWWYLFALFKFFAFGADVYDNEIFIGAYGAAAFMMLQYFGEKYANHRRTFAVLDALQLLLCLPPIVSYVHCFIYGYPIIYEEMLAVYHANFRESVEWVMTYVGWGNTLLIFAVILGMWGGIGLLRTKTMCAFREDCPPRNRYILLLAAAALLYYPMVTMTRTDWVVHFFLANEYSNDAKKYSTHMNQRYEDIYFMDDAQAVDEPHTIVMVIGESACRDRMEAYNEGYVHANTPWLSQCKNDSHFIVFSNAYACQSLTQQVLENALTEKSYYNGKPFLKSTNILDIAKKKGYKTYWITDLFNGPDSASTFSLIASRADVVINTGGDYDDSMLDALKQISPQENNFVVMHGNGLHAAYRERYPRDMAVFPEESREAEYSNAMIYVDGFLKQVYDYGVEHLHLQAMLYFSDHGENLETGHGPSDHSFDKVRIPMFIYLGDEYQKKNPSIFQRLSSRRDSFFTNDMIYNMLCGIMNAESNFYDPSEDLSSMAYSYQLDDLWTFGKAVKVKDDPFL